MEFKEIRKQKDLINRALILLNAISDRVSNNDIKPGETVSVHYEYTEPVIPDDAPAPA